MMIRRRVYHWRGRKYVIKRTNVLASLLKKFVPRLIANELVDVQPMSDEIFKGMDHLFKVRYILPKKKQKWIDRRNSNYGYNKKDRSTN